MLLAQIESLRSLAGKALTTFDAFLEASVEFVRARGAPGRRRCTGFAATFTLFPPNITLVPAFRAGLCFSFSVVSEGSSDRDEE